MPASNGFEPSLLDKLLDTAPRAAVQRRHDIEALKESVAADLESLLNARATISAEAIDGFPLAANSVAGFGLCDFAGLSLDSVPDRKRICDGIRQAIAAHEPRLRDVRVTLRLERRAVNALFFDIMAILVVRPAHEPVSFDAMLQPSTLRYSVRKPRGLGGTAGAIPRAA
ncbi:type VI secretion system baseplate subunit TssE [Cognatazoarcus halotolerans]|uniref:type VI secretion system baseplate subunit TssE n=1 Tax=Cognatazoarcus halotolerans TaxID=2686016 RepID=UPI001359989A|nr:type VI secretion system baseplate subunit TssE [Cognatazoarcus halotolerans]MBX3680511.1 type VI secretion system baseplate subunit TssE [Rhodocyclaceae bacterium]MCB1897881.1 type VI secretion system baseplate subunit TssE [Rhodocyclaceae bacterium]MCP5311217.1 type VI secretion system baseplate subunit TssE [Zoogloeaceae bacterium]